MSDNLLDQVQASLGDSVTLERELGGGGMSRVFVGEERELGRRIVVKVLPPEMSDAVDAERFRRETMLAATLQHPLIVPVLWSGRQGDLLYYTMPFVAGETLRARLEREGELPVADALRILRDVATAVAHAHAHGIVHRDIKPENVLLSNGYALVADFGIARAVESAGAARLTGTGISIGTPAYMSPEQATGDRGLDHRADIYALGVIAYEMLAGRAPFVASSPQSLLAAHLTQTAPPIRTQRPAISPTLDGIVARCLAKSPADRWQSAADLCRAIETELSRSSEPTAAGASGVMLRGASRFRWGITAVVILAALAAAGLIARRKSARTSGAAGEAISSIAVLPFDDASRDRDDEYFSDGVAEELMVALGKGSPLRVASRSSSFAFKGRGLSAQQIGRQLGVEAVIEGSVRQAGGRLRITAQLTRVRDGFSLWSDAYDRELRDVFAVEEELSRSIVSAVRPRLLGAAPTNTVAAPAFAIHGTTDPEAYLLYLRGRYFFNRRTPEGFRSAVQYFSQAIARDSGFARAWAGLADSYCIQANWRMRPTSEVCPLAREAARHALAIDSTTAEAWASLGFVALFYEYDVSTAQRYLRRAVALDSTYATAHLWLMQTYNALGDSARMLEEIRTALRFEPLSLIMNSRYGTALWRSGRPRDAIVQLRRTLDMDPGYTDAREQLASAYAVAGQLDSAAEQLRFTRDTTALAAVIASAGHPDEARRLLAAQHVVACTGTPAIDLIGVYDALGDTETAVRCFQAAYDARDADVIFVSPTFASPRLASDPRFRALLSRVRASWPVVAVPERR